MGIHLRKPRIGIVAIAGAAFLSLVAIAGVIAYAGSESERQALQERANSLKSDLKKERIDSAKYRHAPEALLEEKQSLESIDELLAARKTGQAESRLISLRKNMRPYLQLEPVPSGFAGLSADTALRESHATALNLEDKAAKSMKSKDYKAAENTYVAALTLVYSMDRTYKYHKPLSSRLESELAKSRSSLKAATAIRTAKKTVVTTQQR